MSAATFLNLVGSLPKKSMPRYNQDFAGKWVDLGRKLYCEAKLYVSRGGSSPSNEAGHSVSLVEDSMMSFMSISASGYHCCRLVRFALPRWLPL